MISRLCAQWFMSFTVGGSTPGVTYSVTFEWGVGPRCTCPAFEHANIAPRTCKHVRCVLEHACLWSEHYAGGDRIITPDADSLRTAPRLNDMCPRCAGRVVDVGPRAALRRPA